MLSIIIPVYKVESYLDECVKSVIGQTFRDIEVILVDDGSPDRCPQMCDEWVEKDNRIKVVHKPNGGLSSARNAGLKVATGEYIGFVDSDDYIDATMYEDLMRVMRQDERIMVVSSPIIRNTGGVFTPYKVGTYEYKDGDTMPFSRYMKMFLGLSMDATVWNKLYRREFIQTLFREGRNNEDYLFMYYNVKSLYGSDKLLAVSDKPHYYYRDSPQSICHQAKTSVNRLFFDGLYNFHEIIADAKRWNVSLLPIIEKLQDGVLANACDQILKIKEIRKERPEDCSFVWQELSQVGIFKRGRSLECSLKFIIYRFFPYLYNYMSKVLRLLK